MRELNPYGLRICTRFRSQDPSDKASLQPSKRPSGSPDEGLTVQLQFAPQRNGPPCGQGATPIYRCRYGGTRLFPEDSGNDRRTSF